MPAKAPAETVVDLYETHAAEWDAARGTSLQERAWLDRFLEELPAACRAVLDVGCGGGQPIARYLIDAGCDLTGIDASAALVALAKRRFPGHRLLQADMRAHIPDRAFGGIVAWDSFFHLAPADQRPMFGLFRRASVPGAVLLFTSGPRHGDAIGTFAGQPLYHGSLDPGEYRTLLDANGYSVVDQVVEDPDCGGHTVWLAQLRA